MSPDEWFLDGLARGGHTPRETMDYASALADYEDLVRSLPANVVTVDAEHRFITSLKRWFGR
jgi:hypothetical protein